MQVIFKLFWCFFFLNLLVWWSVSFLLPRASQRKCSSSVSQPIAVVTQASFAFLVHWVTHWTVRCTPQVCFLYDRVVTRQQIQGVVVVLMGDECPVDLLQTTVLLTWPNDWNSSHYSRAAVLVDTHPMHPPDNVNHYDSANCPDV